MKGRKRAAFTELEQLRVHEGLLLRQMVSAFDEQQFALVMRYGLVHDRRMQGEWDAAQELHAQAREATERGRGD